jgi:uncharacterized protein (TIGR02301 family)
MTRYMIALALVIGLATPGHSAQAQATNTSLDDSLSRLSEILGALHYLRPICGFKDDADRWRTQMQALIDAEAQGADRRARMVAGFNRGYSGFQQTYRTCTPAAEVAIRRYLEEGAKIAREVTARYAN